MKYDVLIAGAGLYGATCARELAERGLKVLILESKRIGGNLACHHNSGFVIHSYGPHIFHTSNKMLWDYVNRFTPFDNFIYSPIAYSEGKVYNLPFNMNTFSQIFFVRDPARAKALIDHECEPYRIKTPTNLEEQALQSVGPTIYEMLIKGYTEKHWGRKAASLPASIIKRIPLRFDYNNNYFNDTYQGVPYMGYDIMIDNMLDHKNIEIRLDEFDLNNKDLAHRVIYSGSLDKLFNYCYGFLEYRTIDFNEEVVDNEDGLTPFGNVAVNYCDAHMQYTRSIDYSYFNERCNKVIKKSVVVSEESMEYIPFSAQTPMYPVRTEDNIRMWDRYADLARSKDIRFGGRLGDFKYYDMSDVIMNAINLSKLI